jgi:hypothetical protein
MKRWYSCTKPCKSASLPIHLVHKKLNHELMWVSWLKQYCCLLTLHIGGAWDESPWKTDYPGKTLFLNSLLLCAHIICVTLKCIAVARIWGEWTAWSTSLLEEWLFHNTYIMHIFTVTPISFLRSGILKGFLAVVGEYIFYVKI